MHPLVPVNGTVVANLQRAARDLPRVGGVLPAVLPGFLPGNGVEEAAQALALAFVARSGPALFREFERQAAETGWKLPMTMLNPKQSRLCAA